MKRSMLVVLAGALAVAAAAAGARAAGSDEGGEPGGRRAEFAARMQEHMKKRLGLSDDQAAKMKTIFEDSRKASEPLKHDLKVSLEKLRWQVDAKAGDKDLEATLAQVDKDRKALSSQREKAIERLNKELPAEARAKLALAKFEGMRRRMMLMRRGGHGMGHDGWGKRGHGGPGWGGPREGRGPTGGGPEMGPEGGSGPPPPPPGDDDDTE